MVTLLPLVCQTKPTPCSESRPADESSCSGGGDQGGWNTGQDDTVVHGKHLPPSPRRQPTKSSLKMSKKSAAVPAAPAASPPAQSADVSVPNPHQSDPDPLPTAWKPGDCFSYSPTLSHRVAPLRSSPTLAQTYSSSASASDPSCSPAPGVRARTISDPQSGSEPQQAKNQTASTYVLRRKVMSKETTRQYQQKALQRRESKEGMGSPSRTSHSAVQVPWEKEMSKEGLLGLGLCLGQGKGSGAPAAQDQGLLEEIDSTCCLGAVLHTSLQLSQVNNSHHQVQGKAADDS